MKIVILAAHPDDAETCVGGSIRRYVEAGHDVHVINFTNARGPRVDCAARAGALLGFTHEFLDYPDAGPLGSFVNPELGVACDTSTLRHVQERLQELHPDMVWAHWQVDTNTDHVAVGSLALMAVDNLRLAHNDWHPELWFYFPAPGYQALCLCPDHYEDISPYYELKRRAVAEYDVVDIFSCYPIHETADKYWGYMAGCLYAEAFRKCHFRVGRARFDVVGEKVDVAPVDTASPTA